MASGLIIATCLFAAPSLARAEPLAGFKLDGSSWAYKDDSVEMSGVLLRPEGKGPFPGVLISHGKGGSAQGFAIPKAREFVKWGFVCIAPDYTHAGGPRNAPMGKGKKTFSPDDGASEQNIRRAVKCLDILASLPEVDSRRLCAFGHSMGGFVTIGLAAAEPDRLVAAVITGSGVAPRDGFPAPSADRAGKIRTPFLIMHGSADNVVRPAQSESLKEVLDRNNIANERHVFDGVGHPIDREKSDEMYELTRKWFTRYAALEKTDGKTDLKPDIGANRKQARTKNFPPPRVPPGVKALRDLEYIANGHARQKLDLYVPEESAGPLPLVIWVHGGGWQNGSKNNCPALRLAADGYAVASIGYRLSGDAVFPAQIEDCKAAVRWLRAHAKEHRLDPDRFGVWGSSAGGHLVALLGTSGDVKEFDVGPHADVSSRVQAVCDFYGPTDFVKFVTTPGYESHARTESPEGKLIGGAVLDNKDKAARVNPITYVSADDPPFLIIHGDKDPLVPPNQSESLFAALKEAKVGVHFHTIHGAGHGGPGFASPEIDRLVKDFFARTLLNRSDKPRDPEAVQTESTAANLNR